MEQLLKIDREAWRAKWEAMEQEETRLLRQLTLEEGVKDFLALCQTMAPLMKEAEEFFLPERRAYLSELQERLRRFGEWYKHHGNYPEPA